jgi:hypothetical protein
MILGVMEVQVLSILHIVPTGKTINADYYVNKFFQKEQNPGLDRSL